MSRATITGAYSATGAAWRDGPERVYGRLAEELVARARVPVRGRVVLDLGAGTGAASRALAAAQAHPIALDSALGMLTVDRGVRPPAVVADALSLPFRDGGLGGVVAAFSLNHLTDPVAGLVECSRVVARGGPIVASAYAEDDTHPVKRASEAAATAFGWTQPEWYSEFRASVMPLLATVERARAICGRAGLDAEVTNVRVSFAQLTPADLVAWRFGMMHLAPFVASLSQVQRDALVACADYALGDDPPALVRSVIVISGLARGG